MRGDDDSYNGDLLLYDDHGNCNDDNDGDTFKWDGDDKDTGYVLQWDDDDDVLQWDNDVDKYS